MATIEVKVPDIGNYSDVPVIEVLVKAGDTVKKDQGLVTLESDKATMEVPSPVAGVIKELKVKLGDALAEGHVVALIESGAEGAAAPAPAAPATAAPAFPPSPPATEASAKLRGAGGEGASAAKPSEPTQGKSEPSPGPAGHPLPAGEGKVQSEGQRSPPVAFDSAQVMPDAVPYASPAIRLFARELGVDLMRVKGSGRKGRIVKEDVQNHVKAALAAGPARGAAAGGGGGLNLLPWPQVDFAKFGEIEAKPLSKIKKISGANLARNWAMIPHVTQNEEADITEMEAFRRSAAEALKDVKLTPLVFLIKAVVAGLKKFPSFNASLDASGENLVLKKYFHVGIAVDTPEGLVVPVIRDCDRKSLVELALELGTLSGKARDRKLGPAEMSGGCFSISSLGGIGGTGFTPIINAPEVAILGVSKSQTRPQWNGSAFVPRLMLPLSLSYDHRVIDGAEAARFAAYLAQVLGDIRRLLL